VDQARRLALLVGQALQQPIDMALGAAAALHGQAMRLVEDVDILVFVKDQIPHELRIGLVDLGRPDDIGIIDRRDAHGLAANQPRTGGHLGLVDLDLTIADELLQASEAELGEMGGKPAIKTHPVFIAFHLPLLNATHATPRVTKSPR
jgi:hypothetical protein